MKYYIQNILFDNEILYAKYFDSIMKYYMQNIVIRQ